jgi:hypothetical protein
MLQAFYQAITPVQSVFRYLQQIKLVTNKFFALSLIIFTPLCSKLGHLECNLLESRNISMQDVNVIIRIPVIKSKDNSPSLLQTPEDHFVDYATL